MVELLLKYCIPLIISIGLCWLLFRDFNLKEMWRIISQECDFSWIIVMFVISILSHIVRAMRWQIQLYALGVRAPLFYVILSIFGTYAVNLVFPRLGEIWRTGYIAKRENAPFATVFGSMVADRVADSITVLILLAVAFVVASGSLTEYLTQTGGAATKIIALLESPILWGAIAACIIILWMVLTIKTGNTTLVKIQELFKGLWKGFSVILSMHGRGRWLLLTVALWGCYFLQFYVSLFSFPFTTELLAHYGITPAFVGFTLSAIAMGVPSNGGIGPWQWAVIFAFGIYGLDGEQAGAFANLALGSSTLLVIALGLFTFITIALTKSKTTINHYE